METTETRARKGGRALLVVVGIGALALVLAMCTGFVPGMHRAVDERAASAVPVPVVDEQAQPPGTVETAVLAGGCFWGVQGVFQHVNGVLEAESGYAGGDGASANYSSVSTGTTGHAESVRITYDPNRITYGQLLQVFFAVVHDPTQLDRQGPDTGTQYRSAIFTHDETQQRIADAYIAQLTRANVFGGPIVTRIEPNKTFYPAERYHQDYLNSNPHYPYIAINDIPKVEALKDVFPDRYREQPVLVLSSQ